MGGTCPLLRSSLCGWSAWGSWMEGRVLTCLWQHQPGWWGTHRWCQWGCGRCTRMNDKGYVFLKLGRLSLANKNTFRPIISNKRHTKIGSTSSSWSPTYWGQRVTYPVGTLWLHCDFLNNVPSHQPVGTCWVLLQSAQWVHAGHIVKVPIKVATGYFVKELPGFFHDFV